MLQLALMTDNEIEDLTGRPTSESMTATRHASALQRSDFLLANCEM